MSSYPAFGAAAGAVAGALLGVPVAIIVRRFVPTRPPPWPAAVLATATLCAAAGGVADDWLGVGAAAALTAALLALSLIDLAVLRLPDLLTLPLLSAGLAWSATREGGLTEALIGAAAGFFVLVALAAFYRRGRGRDGLGRGDAKLLAAGGAWLGWAALPWVVLLACGVAFVWIGVRLVRDGRASLAQPLPFGPALAAGIWITFVLGAPAGL